MGEAGSKAKKWVYYIVFVLSVSAALIHLYYPMFGIWKTNRIIHLMLFLLIVLLTHPLKSENPKFNKLGRMLDGVLVLGVLAFSVHPLIDFDSFLLRAESLTRADVWMGTLGTLLTLEAVRRTLGLPMIILTVSSIAYALLGAHLPDLIAHKGAFWEDIINFVYVLPEGLYGLPIAVMTSYVFLFIIFGALLEASGGITHIMNFSNALVGKSIGGPAKISVISSGMMGSISGSAIANVVTTGTMTIPMMKRIGFSPHLAGGIEAIASTGGLIMPPIMGAAAFVMCEMVGIPYVKVIVMAAIPAVLYYFTLFIIVHLEAKRVNLDSNDLQKDRLSIYQSIRKGWWVAIPVLFLVASLVFQYSPSRSVVISILSLMVIIIVKNGIQEGIKLILQAFHSAARATGPISILCAAAGIIIGMLFLTGLGLKFSGIVLTLAHGIPIVALLLVMCVCIVLGMGLPVTASYITTVTLSAPALVAFGFPLPAIHLFIIFFAVLSGITPPVCLASYTAAGVADSDLMKTSWVALKYGFTGYIIPYLFIFTPSLLIVDSTFWEILQNVIGICIGLMALAAGVVGFIERPLTIVKRMMFVGSGLLLISYWFTANLIGFFLFLGMFLYHKNRLPFFGERFAKKTEFAE